MNGADFDRYCAEHDQEFINALMTAIRIPSISAQPDRARDVRRHAEHVMAVARDVGFIHAELIETAGHPAVYAERMVDAKLPTVLVYGHHDVQPADPLDEWTSPPFEPEIRENRLYGRGAVDDKGQVFMHLNAVAALLHTNGELPVNLKLIIEGEEEIGSTNFDALVAAHQERLACDVAVISDTAFVGTGIPSMCIGLRGLVSVEVTVDGPSLDLHSGIFGGAVQNPAIALARIIAALKDPATERVAVPGFYDRVRPLTEQERQQIADVPFEESEFLHQAGDASAAVGESGYTTLERRWARPTLEVNGIWGGYQGVGSKTIIPARAHAKLSARLVPDQDPGEIAAALEAAIRAAVPEGVRVHVETHGHGRPVLTSADHPAVRAAARCIEEVFGRAPIFTREGGSIPPVETLQRVLGVPAVLLGFGLPDDQIHAPNEKFDLDQYRKGIRVVGRLWAELATVLAG